MVDLSVRYKILDPSRYGFLKREVMLNKYVMFFGRNHLVDRRGITSRNYILIFFEIVDSAASKITTYVKSPWYPGWHNQLYR